MDEVARTSAVYEADAESFVEKYRRQSIADLFWDEVAPVFPGERLLDVGCGPGADTATFASNGFDVVGFDLTRSFLEAARQDVAAPFVRGDMRSLPFSSETFDGVWASASLLHVPRADAPDALREFRRVLDTPGAAIVTLKRGAESGHAEDDRYFERYTAPEGRALAETAGFGEITVERSGDRWLQLTACVED